MRVLINNIDGGNRPIVIDQYWKRKIIEKANSIERKTNFHHELFRLIKSTNRLVRSPVDGEKKSIPLILNIEEEEENCIDVKRVRKKENEQTNSRK